MDFFPIFGRSGRNFSFKSLSEPKPSMAIPFVNLQLIPQTLRIAVLKEVVLIEKCVEEDPLQNV